MSLVEDSRAAAPSDGLAEASLSNRLKLGEGVGLAGGRDDASRREPVVGGELLELAVEESPVCRVRDRANKGK